MDKTGLFFMLGEKVNPLVVIWRYANPHCFKAIKKDQLSVYRVLFKKMLG